MFRCSRVSLGLQIVAALAKNEGLVEALTGLTQRDCQWDSGLVRDGISHLISRAVRQVSGALLGARIGHVRKNWCRPRLTSVVASGRQGWEPPRSSGRHDSTGARCHLRDGLVQPPKKFCSKGRALSAVNHVATFQPGLQN